MACSRARRRCRRAASSDRSPARGAVAAADAARRRSRGRGRGSQQRLTCHDISLSCRIMTRYANWQWSADDDLQAAGQGRGRGGPHGGSWGGGPGWGGDRPWRDGPPFGPPWAGFLQAIFGLGRGPRARRGDVRAAILVLLDEEPRNGYQL